MARRRAGEAALETRNRRDILELIRANPGLHAGEIERRTGQPPSTVAYHLQYLSDLGMIEAHDDGFYKRYFVAGEIGRVERSLLRALRQRIPRRIVASLLLAQRGATNGELAEEHEVTPSTVSYHVGKLLAAGIVAREGEGKGARYRLVAHEDAARALLTYRASFLDDVVDRVLETWVGLGP